MSLCSDGVCTNLYVVSANFQTLTTGNFILLFLIGFMDVLVSVATIGNLTADCFKNYEHIVCFLRLFCGR